MQELKSILAKLSLATALMIFVAGCNAGTEEPAAPAPEMPEASTSEPKSSGPDAERPAAQSAEQDDIDASRFPQSLPEGAAAEIPANFPSDMPVYPGAAAAQGRGGLVNGKDLSAVQLLSNAPPSEALSYYERELASSGWEIEKSENRGEAASLSVRRGDCKVSILIVPSEGGGSDIFNVSECGE